MSIIYKELSSIWDDLNSLVDLLETDPKSTPIESVDNIVLDASFIDDMPPLYCPCHVWKGFHSSRTSDYSVVGKATNRNSRILRHPGGYP